jgi:hypothetical protein
LEPLLILFECLRGQGNDGDILKICNGFGNAQKHAAAMHDFRKDPNTFAT